MAKKRVHFLKFQSVVLPNGIIATLARPYEGRRHDSTMLQQSGLSRVAHSNDQPLCLYGDSAYPLRIHLQAPFQGRVLTDEMQAYNKAMSSVRVSMEWMFGNITKYFSFIDFKRQMKLILSAIGKIYVVSALIENGRTCLPFTARGTSSVSNLLIFGKNAYLLSYFKNIKKNFGKYHPGGEKILSSTLDNVHCRNEIIKIYNIIKYIFKIIFSQNLLANYTKYNWILIQTNFN